MKVVAFLPAKGASALSSSTAPAARDIPALNDPPCPPAPPRNLRLVEDNALNRLLLRRFLEAGGHSVTEAADGIEGTARAAETAFDLILMDISMPRMDGIAATRAIRTGGGPSARTVDQAGPKQHFSSEKAHFQARAGPSAQQTLGLTG